MKKVLYLFVTMLLLSGCIDKKINDGIKEGDLVTIDYTEFLNESIIDTTIEKIAIDNNISKKEFKPLIFKVGEKAVIKGLEEGVIGMKLGESKNLTIPPEKAYLKNPELIKIIPVTQKLESTRTLEKVFEIPATRFEFEFGENHTTGDDVFIPETNVRLTVQNISSNVSLSYNLTVGDIIRLAPYKEKVVKIDENSITLKSEAAKGEIIQLKGAAWNSTVVDIDSENMTLRHNYIPDTKIRTTFGVMNVHFNDTNIIMDLNNELAGKTLVFNVTIRSISEEDTK